MRKRLFMLVIWPLAACFDTDLRIVAHNDDHATLSVQMKMGPELYQMASADGSDLCPQGVGTVDADGAFRCVLRDHHNIDTLIATLTDRTKPVTIWGGANAYQGVAIERLPGPFLKLSLDLAELKRSAAKSGVSHGLMTPMAPAFDGHHVQLIVKGQEVIETNGMISADRTTAVIKIPLTTLLQTDSTLPDHFVTIIRTE